ncbi:MAG: hypothetical protein AAGA36_11920 [Pseudomonadota bacterium]
MRRFALCLAALLMVSSTAWADACKDAVDDAHSALAQLKSNTRDLDGRLQDYAGTSYDSAACLNLDQIRLLADKARRSVSSLSQACSQMARRCNGPSVQKVVANCNAEANANARAVDNAQNRIANFRRSC